MMTDLSTARRQTPGKTSRTGSYNFAVHFAWTCTTVLWLALSGSVAAAEKPALSADVAFEIVLPVRIGYDALRDKIMEVIAGSSKGDSTIREVQIYPSSGKLVVGLRVAKAAETDPAAGEWVYLSATPNVDGEKQILQLSDLAADNSIANDIGALLGSDQLVGQLRDQASVSYAAAWQNLLDSANRRLTRPLKNGYRMEVHLTSEKLDRVLLSSDGISVALRASGDLKILYGL